MNEPEFVEESLRLKNQLFGLKTSLEHLRKLFEFCSKQLDKKTMRKRKNFSAVTGTSTITSCVFSIISPKTRFTM